VSGWSEGGLISGLGQWRRDLQYVNAMRRYPELGLFDRDLLLALSRRVNVEKLCEFFIHSKSQIRQDLFVAATLNFKREGFFVEFGATDGVALSNSHMLEKIFGWKGILAEPATCWREALKANRSAAIDTRCVWARSGEKLLFNEVAELSTIEAFSESDWHDRHAGQRYEVNIISLNDLLTEHKAPRNIDYLSIDTEGSEFDILSNLDWQRYSFRVITCEHNFTPSRDKICALLASHGYKRVHEHLSQFDDWYVKNGV
jgi:FkbM family methyltransferase